ncbi:MAG: SigB/SigF/SigG family RNA polymerase sigma factor [Actinomycetota bacterium]|nr:SigB/SigF/SigG family RNA polymerase sigma factor [Actinomycetota bacterium]
MTRTAMTGPPGTATTDTKALFDRWRRSGDRQSRDQLIEQFLPLAHKLARRYLRSGEPYEDLLQVASLGLVKAVERFDPTCGYAFTSFAVPTILGELKRYFRDSSWAVHVDRGAQERARKVAGAQQAVSTRTGRAPTVGELSQYLECSEEEVLDGLQTAEAHDAVSLDAPAPAPSDAYGLASRVEAIPQRDERLELVDQASTVFEAARHLPERERQILYLRFGEDLRQSEIARRVGVSQMQVSRLLRRSLQRLRVLADDSDSSS